MAGHGSADDGTRTSLFAIAFFAGAVAIGALVARQHNIAVEATVTFLEALFREMVWTWSLGGFLLALLGCITAEKARNRGASGFLMGPLAALSFLLAIGYAVALAATMVDGGVARLFEVFR